MHHRRVEQIALGRSWIHRLDPRIKLPAALLLVATIATRPQEPWFHFVAPLTLILLGLLLAKLPLGFVFSRTLMVLPFVAMVALFLPFSQGEEVVHCFDSPGICIYREGLGAALAILLKGILAIMTVAWLVFTTPFNHLLQAMRALKVPQVVVAVLAFLFRYLDIMADESMRMRRARLARSAGRRVRWPARSTGGMVGRLFLRALDRAERVYRAMLARGFDGEIRLFAKFVLKKSDLGFASVLLVFVCIYGSFTHAGRGI